MANPWRGKRWILMSPLALFILLYLSMFCTGIPLLARTIPMSAKLPPGNAASGETLPSEATAATAQVVQNPNCWLHGVQADWMVVATWLLVPLVASFPLAPSWRNVRRKKTALAATLLLLLLALTLILLESFTGYFIGRMLRSDSGVVQGTFVRFAVLHSLGFPILIILVLGFVLWVQVRLARRAASD